MNQLNHITQAYHMLLRCKHLINMSETGNTNFHHDLDKALEDLDPSKHLVSSEIRDNTLEEWYKENTHRYGLGSFKSCEWVWKAALATRKPVSVDLHAGALAIRDFQETIGYDALRMAEACAQAWGLKHVD